MGPLIDDVLEKLHGGKLFSKVDIRCGYWVIKLSLASSLLTTFNTPFRRYRWNRMPFGLVCAQDVFKKFIYDSFADLPGVTGISDDIIVFGVKADGSDHDQNFEAILRRAKELNIKFNEEKTVHKQRAIPFYGLTLTDEGLKPDAKKIQMIQQIERPRGPAALRSFLGLANLMNRFVPGLSTTTAPLRALLKKGSDGRWNQQAIKAFQRVKTSIAQITTMRFFNPAQPLVLQAKASPRSLGAALLQNNEPIAFASKTLSKEETGYVATEREMLAVAFGIEKFRHYIYGRQVTIETNCLPLVRIIQKPHSAAPPRLQNILLRIHGYDARVALIPDNKMFLADIIVRAF